MIGAIIGDIAGSAYEFDPVTSEDFAFFAPGADYTDDSLMTIAVGRAVSEAIAATPDGDAVDLGALERGCVVNMRALGRRFPHPTGAYGGRFSDWLQADDPRPYGSWGNGAPMRVSAAGELARSVEEAMDLAAATARVTHDHPEGIKGAQAVAVAIHLACCAVPLEEIRAHVDAHFYPMDRTLAQIRPGYEFDESSQGTTPESLTAVFESSSFEDAIRNAIWLGGDADTMGAIAGSVAWAHYASTGGVTAAMRQWADRALSMLPGDLREFVEAYEARLRG